ncbi:ribosome maturation factor RimM [Pelodictyon luteolum]|uniref:Ribosome maturation factor RimM n=1 Tax=Chlorobium luteolum (strain DSM 273 / BCRC 81028 / 2530) TaxID=319225 RepID=RIMM_CHLL3|nr:ribosome maturation factor RimM [Pelodictyon luteolum]Q3B4A2.1 RecName: Full=Ribosome maturation factor RimM [Pelodictyon luteolum DSM 273]ABB23829.1 16S rRNA processing protein RimM [Pelodictyon luteolum DSM 273]
MELWLTGIVLKPRGLKGEVKVKPVTDYPEKFLSRKSYWVGGSPGDAVPLAVKHASLAGGFAWLFLEGVDSREKAEALAGRQLFIEASEAEPRKDDRAWLHELEGMKVLGAGRKEVGVLKEVLSMPAHEVYEIISGGRSVLVPAIEEFVEEISLEGRYIHVPRFDEFL